MDREIVTVSGSPGSAGPCSHTAVANGFVHVTGEDLITRTPVDAYLLGLLIEVDCSAVLRGNG
jgi:hypothetical protein